jgi:orotate phosphoribosyltransferase-like protein
MEHLSSFTLQKTFVAPSRLVVVDDVVTSGTTMMACALKLADAFPGVPIGGFALARVQSEGSPDTVLSPLVEVIVPAGRRCSRRAV